MGGIVTPIVPRNLEAVFSKVLLILPTLPGRRGLVIIPYIRFCGKGDSFGVGVGGKAAHANPKNPYPGLGL
jgi:hypothetical protein